MSNEAPTDALRLVQAIRDWLREPDNAESFSFNDLVEWLNRRPVGLVTAALEALAAAPASPLPEGGGPHERWSILNHLGGFWTPENFDTERQAVAYLDRWKRDNPKMDLSRHKVVPVLVTITAAPTGDARNGKGEG